MNSVFLLRTIIHEFGVAEVRVTIEVMFGMTSMPTS